MARITEIKTIDVNDECVDNPVYLKWLNTLGGFSQWLFGTMQTDIIQTSVDGEYMTNINDDLENSIGGNEYISKDAQPQLVIGANVPVSKMDGMKGLIMSPKVLMLSNPNTWQTDGAKWIRVRVQTGSFIVLKTNETRNQVEMVLLLPKLNIQAE
jgi:hypothetical protein